MEQLELIDPPVRAWRLDRKTIETGRKGIAEAREALRQAADRARQTQGEAA